MKYKLKVKALDDLNVAGSRIMGTIIHTTGAKSEDCSCKVKHCAILVGYTYFY